MGFNEIAANLPFSRNCPYGIVSLVVTMGPGVKGGAKLADISGAIGAPEQVQCLTRLSNSPQPGIIFGFQLPKQPKKIFVIITFLSDKFQPGIGP